MNLDQLVINNQKYTYDTVHLIPDYIKSRISSENKPSVKYSETVTIFFTKRSPLSNFHDAEFTVNDESYVNVEQYLSQQKASLLGCTNVAADIMELVDPVAMKKTVKSLPTYDEDTWRAEAPDFLKTALHAKFSQNEDLKDALLETAETTIGEASPSDTLFGIGLSITNPKAMDISTLFNCILCSYSNICLQISK